MEQMAPSGYEILSAFLDDELELADIKRVQILLNSSYAWRKNLEILRDTKSMLENAAPVSPPLDLVEELKKEAEPYFFPSRKNFWQWPQTWFVVSTVAALTIVFGLWMGHRPVRGSSEPIDYVALLAVHNGRETGLSSQDGIIAVANYSSHLKRIQK